MIFHNDPSNDEKSLLIQKNSYPYMKRLEYVKKWQNDSFNEINQFKKPYSEMKDTSQTNHSTLSTSNLNKSKPKTPSDSDLVN